MYIFMCVPATGYTAPGIAQNRVGPLPAHSPSAGGRRRARGGHLQRRGASCPCSSPANCWAGVLVCWCAGARSVFSWVRVAIGLILAIRVAMALQLSRSSVIFTLHVFFIIYVFLTQKEQRNEGIIVFEVEVIHHICIFFFIHDKYFRKFILFVHFKYVFLKHLF